MNFFIRVRRFFDFLATLFPDPIKHVFWGRFSSKMFLFVCVIEQVCNISLKQFYC